MASSPTKLVFVDDVDPLDEAVWALQRFVMQHPVAAQSLFSMFVGEGRSYSETEIGAQWLSRLSDSELVARTRFAFDAFTARSLENKEEVQLPSAIVDALVKTASDPNMESLIQDLFLRGPYAGLR